jgi:hypothetical protein
MPDTTHDCPCGCGSRINSNHFACRAGWRKLPADLRVAIVDTYRRDPAGHREAMADARQWYAAAAAEPVHPTVERIARRLATLADGTDRLWRDHVRLAQDLGQWAIVAFLRNTAACATGYLSPGQLLQIADQMDTGDGHHG